MRPPWCGRYHGPMPPFSAAGCSSIQPASRFIAAPAAEKGGIGRWIGTGPTDGLKASPERPRADRRAVSVTTRALREVPGCSLRRGGRYPLPGPGCSIQRAARPAGIMKTLEARMAWCALRHAAKPKRTEPAGPGSATVARSPLQSHLLAHARRCREKAATGRESRLIPRPPPARGLDGDHVECVIEKLGGGIVQVDSMQNSARGSLQHWDPQVWSLPFWAGATLLR